MKKSKFNELIKNPNKLVLIDFYADWCGPCKSMEPTIKKLAKELSSNLAIYKVNIDKNPALATDLGVKSIPSFLLYRNGKVVWRQVGGQTYHQLKSNLEVFTNR